MTRWFGAISVPQAALVMMAGWSLFFFVRFKFIKHYSSGKAAVEAIGAGFASFMCFFFAGEFMHGLHSHSLEAFVKAYFALGLAYTIFPYAYCLVFCYRRRRGRQRLQ